MELKLLHRAAIGLATGRGGSTASPSVFLKIGRNVLSEFCKTHRITPALARDSGKAGTGKRPNSTWIKAEIPPAGQYQIGERSPVSGRPALSKRSRPFPRKKRDLCLVDSLRAGRILRPFHVPPIFSTHSDPQGVQRDQQGRCRQARGGNQAPTRRAAATTDRRAVTQKQANSRRFNGARHKLNTGSMPPILTQQL